MAASIGGVFETEIQKVFKQLKESHLVGWHRLSDSAAAGSIVAAQPSDYLLALPPGSVNLLDSQRLMFLEVKASEAKSTLGKDMVRPAQRGAIGHFRLLLDLPYLILFWDAERGTIQMWDGVAVQLDARISKLHMLAEWQGCGTVNRLRHDTVAQYLVDYFQIPSKADTLEKVR